MNEPIAHVDFVVSFAGDQWVTEGKIGDLSVVGTGSTPITALMVAEAKARVAVRQRCDPDELADAFEAREGPMGVQPEGDPEFEDT